MIYIYLYSSKKFIVSILKLKIIICFKYNILKVILKFRYFVQKFINLKMASRGGPRPTGTDGNDFMHREKVASQYAIR
jgi:hypothetical protein